MTFAVREITTLRTAKTLALSLLIAALISIVYFNVGPNIIILYQSYYQPLNVSQFVGFDDSVGDGRRLGNQIFALAAVIYVSQLTGRHPVLQRSNHLSLEDVFQLNFEHFDNICPCFKLSEERYLSFDEAAETSVFTASLLARQSILVSGFRQSWKYTRTIDRRLRHHLIFRDDIENAAEMFLETSLPSGWKRAGFVRVGVHVRRGDIMKPDKVEFGYTVPNETYFQKAMGYFIEKYGRVQFIVASDDFDWTREHIIIDQYSPDAINITYSVNHTAGEDLALLSMCDHVIMSTGTFGWWAAWLAKGTTIYYSDWPREGSGLYAHFKREDFFPPNWIPMSDHHQIKLKPMR